MRLNHSVRLTSLVALASLVGGLVLTACNGSDAHFGSKEGTSAGDPASASDESLERTASISLALVNAPSDALCLELAIAPTTSTWGGKSQLFDITPGSSPTLTMNGLPSGSASLAARSFGVACAQVQASTSPTWVSAGAVPVTLVAGQTVSTTIVLRRPGGIQVTASFDDGTLTLSPTTKDFGSVQITGYLSSSIAVTNPGTAAISLSAPTLSGTDASQFSVIQNGCGTSVAAGATCYILIVFRPTTVGVKTATLNVADATASLTGTGLTGVLTFTPSPAVFPNTPVGSNNSLTLTLTNTSSSALSLGGWSVAPSGEFDTTTNNCITLSSLAASSSCTVVVKFTPAAAGTRTGTLTVAAGATVTLTGLASSLSLSPATKDFGSVQVSGYLSSSIGVTNSGTAAVALPTPTLSGTDASQFSVIQNGCGTSVAAGATCYILIVFRPTTVGVKTATLNVADATASLTGTGLTGVLTFTPSPAVFPNTPVGSNNSLSLTLTNTSSLALSLGGWSVAPSGEFDTTTNNCITLSSLAASSSCTVVVKFTPAAAGTRTGTLTVAAGATVTLTGLASSLSLSPATKDFGSVQVSGYLSSSIGVTNSGTAAVALPTPTLSGTDASQFSVIQNGCGTSVAAGATCYILIVFRPTTIGVKTATLNVADATASLTGTGLTGVLTFTPSPAVFPNTPVGSNNSLTLTLTNTSSSALSLGGWSVAPSGEFDTTTNNCITLSSLAASSSCTVVVKFTPAAAGTRTGTLTVAAGATVILTGLASSLSLSPATKDFGSVQVSGYLSSSIGVTNSGAAAVALPTPTLSGTDASQFSVIQNGCGTSVAAGATCYILIVFRPTTIGVKTATLNVADATASLTGTGLTGVLTFTPSPAVFPNTPVGSNNSLTLTLTNTSSSALSLGGWSVAPSGEFDTTTNNCITLSSLAASSSCTVVVKFTPAAAGTRTGTLTVAAGATVILTGTTPMTAVYRINAGSNTAVSPFAVDQYYSGGSMASYSNTINVSGVTNAAPAAIYQTEHWGNSTYTFPSLTASASYTVRLHFAELYWSAAGKRSFNVAINGSTVLTNFDTYARPKFPWQ
jgi:hypothetical protein